MTVSYNSSIFVNNFSPPKWWRQLTLVQLCADDFFLQVAERFEKYYQNIQWVIRYDSRISSSKVVAKHRRPKEPTSPFSSYLENDFRLPTAQDTGVVFVFCNERDPVRTQRCDHFLDLMEDRFIHLGKHCDDSTALVDNGQAFVCWSAFFSLHKVRKPDNDTTYVSAYVADEVKQRILDLAAKQAAKGPLVEVGRLYGGTAALIGMAAKAAGQMAYSFDPFPHYYNDRYLKLFDVHPHLTLLDLSSSQGAALWRLYNLPPISFLHIDGDHCWDAVSLDIQIWEPLLAPGAILMFDDYGYPYPTLAGSTRAICQQIEGHPEKWTSFQTLGRSLAVKKVTKDLNNN